MEALIPRHQELHASSGINVSLCYFYSIGLAQLGFDEIYVPHFWILRCSWRYSLVKHFYSQRLPIPNFIFKIKCFCCFIVIFGKILYSVILKRDALHTGLQQITLSEKVD